MSLTEVGLVRASPIYYYLFLLRYHVYCKRQRVYVAHLSSDLLPVSFISTRFSLPCLTGRVGEVAWIVAFRHDLEISLISIPDHESIAI